MATPTYTLIDSTVLGSSASSVTFSGISATGKGDLVLVAEVTGSGGLAAGLMRVNSDSGANYRWVTAIGTGSTTVSSSTSSTTGIGSGLNADTTEKAIAIFQLMDYSATDKHKSVLVRGNNVDRGTYMYANRWANTSAITSIEVLTTTNQFAAGSSFYLYQIVSE